MTKRSWFGCVLIIGAGLLMPVISEAALVNFDNTWSSHYSSTGITVTNATSAAGTNAAVSFNLKSTGISSAAGGLYNCFPATTLGTTAGDSITFKFTIAFTTNTGSAANLDRKLSFGLAGPKDKLFALVDSGTGSGTRLTFGGYVDNIISVDIGTLYRGDIGQPVTNSTGTYTGAFTNGAGAALDTTYTLTLTRTATGADLNLSQAKTGNNWSATTRTFTAAEANAIILDKVFVGVNGGTGGDWIFTINNLSLNVIPAPAGSAPVVIPTKLDANWESGTWDSALIPAPDLNYQNVGDSNTTTVASTNHYVEASTNFARSGSYSLKSFAQPPALRSEFAFMDNAYRLNPGEEYYYSVSYCPGTNWLAVSPWSTILTQWKNFSSGPSAVFRLSNDGEHRPEFQSLAGAGNTNTYYFEELPLNEWTDFVYYFKWTTNSTGVIKIWRNGNLVLNIAGPTLLLNSQAYMQMGMYTEIGQPRTVYYDNARIGTNVMLNFPPVFTNDPFSATNATKSTAYSSTIAGSATDADSDPLTYAKVSGPSWLSVAGSGVLSGTPDVTDVGTNTFTVKVEDGYDGVDLATLNILVKEGNRVPVFTADPISKTSATEDVSYTGQTLSGSATDADGDTLTYSAQSGPAWLSVSTSGALSGTPANSDVGANSWQVQVSDGKGGTDIATLNITVANVNDAPVFTTDPISTTAATEDVAYTGQTLAGSATDVDAGATLNYSKVSGPAWLSIATDGTLSGTPANADNGANSWTVQVSDGLGETDTAVLNITVNAFNDAPVFTADPINQTAATEDVAYSATIAGSATDEEGAALTYSKVSGPTWLSVASDGTLSGTPSNSDVGANSWTVQVSDGTLTDTAALNITVASINDAPVFTVDPMSRADASSGIAYSGQTLAGSATDEENATLTYLKISGPAWLQIATSGALTGTPVSTNAGANSWTVQVSDGLGGTDTAVLNINVVVAQLTNTFTSVNAQDGWVLESSETSNIGGTSNSTAATTSALIIGDDTSKRQYKTVVSFDTSALPDGATIISATLRLKRGTISQTPASLGSINVDIKNGTGFNGAVALTKQDFEAAADATGVATMSYPSADGTWSTGALNAAGLAQVNKTGTTQLRVYFATDDDNDSKADYLGFYSGEGAAGNKPELVIVYQ